MPLSFLAELSSADPSDFPTIYNSITFFIAFPSNQSIETTPEALRGQLSPGRRSASAHGASGASPLGLAGGSAPRWAAWPCPGAGGGYERAPWRKFVVGDG